MTRRLLAALALGCALAGGAACQSSKPWTLQDQFAEVVGDIERLLGASSLPGRHLAAIRDVHDRKSWTFRPDAENPLEVTREAVRALRAADYATWAEAALVVQVLSSMADEHPSALVRAEALDSLTQMAPWTFDAEVPAGRTATDAEVIEALKTLKEARGKDDSDPHLSFQVASAVGTLAVFPFDAGEVVPQDADEATAARDASARLRTARGVLLALTGSTLEGFHADPDVRTALDRAYVSVSASVIRLTLAKAALADATDATRTAAVRNLAVVKPPSGASLLVRVLRGDRVASVRREAALSLARWPAEEGVPSLVDALADDMPEVRGAAARSLSEVTGQSFGDDRAAWTRWWQARSAGAAPAAPPAEEPAR